MQSIDAPIRSEEASLAAPERSAHSGLHLYAILGLFIAIYFLSWPIVFSFNLWILKDRGSFLNLDYLLAQHLRLGVDTFYSYGLLPVALQHWLFVLFGRGYWPLLGCAVATMVLIAFFCDRFLRHLPKHWIWFAAILALAGIVNIVNPNLPYSLVQLSILFALLLVLDGRMDAALAVAAIGCWCVPSLPLVLTAMLAGLLSLAWLRNPTRSLNDLLRSLLPGIATYLGVGLLLALEFGWKSVLATATPLAGMGFYKQAGFGTTHALMDFLHPAGHGVSYYVVYTLFTPVAWWVFSTVCLIACSALAVLRLIARRDPNGQLDPRDTVIVLCGAIHCVFFVAAYGSTHQHYLYDPILIVGALLGLSAIRGLRSRGALLTGFLLLGVAGEATLVRADLLGWKETRSPETTANLYADRAWVAEWKGILDLSAHRNLLLLAYSTGAHHYFPTIHSPQVWMFHAGLLLPADKARVLHQVDEADVVVLDLTSPSVLAQFDPDFQRHLAGFCRTESTSNFQVLVRADANAGKPCASGVPVR